MQISEDPDTFILKPRWQVIEKSCLGLTFAKCMIKFHTVVHN